MKNCAKWAIITDLELAPHLRKVLVISHLNTQVLSISKLNTGLQIVKLVVSPYNNFKLLSHISRTIKERYGTASFQEFNLSTNCKIFYFLNTLSTEMIIEISSVEFQIYSLISIYRRCTYNGVEKDVYFLNSFQILFGLS